VGDRRLLRQQPEHRRDQLRDHPPVVAPAIPCSSSAQPTPTPTATPTATTWTGVFERVTADLESDGSVKKTPRQFTRVSAEGSEPVTVDVPMSDKRLHRRDRGKKPSFSNGMAHVDLDPSGTKTQEFDSDFAGSLAVAVKVSFTVNGKPVSASDVKHKSGTVEVEYQLDNTTAKPVTVCFKGFNGAKTKQTVSTPIPIIAYLSFTVPSSASSFHAPGASLAPARKGVGASWLAAMFPPLGKTAQTFTFTMDTSKAQIPEAHLLLETLNPLSAARRCRHSRPTPSSPNPVGHVDGFGPPVLAEDVGVGVQGHGRRVAELLGELDDRSALLADQQGGERVSQIVRARAAQASSSRGGMEVSVAPVVPVVRVPRIAVGPPGR
jgi:hypothetical protein